MVSFKSFLEEDTKKKLKPDTWHTDDRMYSRLRDMQVHLTRDLSERQLFVPKHRDPTVMRGAETRRRVYSALRDIQSVTENAPPILTGRSESPPGHNKPDIGFWTSSLTEMSNGYSSEWYEYIKETFPTWQTDYGYTFDIVNAPRIFDTSYADSFYEWAMDHELMNTEETSWAKPYSAEHMRSYFPWNLVSRYFEAAYCSGHSGPRGFTYGWDVESTVWFDTKYLKYTGAVQLSQVKSDYEDDV